MDPKLERKWRRQIKEDANGICEQCGRYAPHGQADHIIPVADGGAKYDIANGRWLCYPCHKEITIRENRERTMRRAALRRRDRDGG
jgi:5-methylcytosine-specific restriction endonuclease McrA